MVFEKICKKEIVAFTDVEKKMGGKCQGSDNVTRTRICQLQVKWAAAAAGCHLEIHLGVAKLQWHIEGIFKASCFTCTFTIGC